jgi:glycosyltransferase involved in cell wall biosynthesis
MAPFVSFVIPTYNRSRQLTNAIHSALRQTDPEIEVIVVDDGSTDDTETMTRAIADPRVRYHRQENSERGAARNFGVRHAQGTYVYFLDSDDVVTPDHVAHARGILDSLGRPQVLHSRFQRVRVDERGETHHLAAPCPDRPDALFRRLLQRNMVGCYLFVRRDIALLHPYIEDRRLNVGEDWYLALVLGCRYPIFVTGQTTRSVISHGEQTMQTIPPDRCLLAGDLLAEYLGKDAHFMRHHGASIPRIRAELTSLAALRYALLGFRKQAIRALADAAWNAPRSVVDRRTLATIKQVLRRKRAVPPSPVG